MADDKLSRDRYGRIIGTEQSDLIFGTEGDDIIYSYYGNDRIYAGGGNDTVYGHEGHDSIFGNDGNDTLFGGSGNDYIYGDRDNDTLYGESGNDYLSGGDGNDILIAGSGDDFIDGDAGNDYLSGGAGNDALYAGKGDDTLHAGSGNDYLSGEAGNDTLYASTDGVTTMHGGAGQDTFWLTETAIHEDNHNLGTLGQSNTLDIIQDFSAEDRIDVTNIVHGYESKHSNDFNEQTYFKISQSGDGHYYLKTVGSGEFQTETSGSEYRWFTADNAVARIENYNNEQLSVYKDANGNWYVAHTDSVPDNAQSVQSVFNTSTYHSEDHRIMYGTDQNDTLIATEGDTIDQIYGGDGNDQIHAGAGDDYLDGGMGDDKLFGNSGDDILNAGYGNDDLFGGEGNDTLYASSDGITHMHGGSGQDTFWLSETAAGDDNRDLRVIDQSTTLDVILDFSGADRINVTTVVGSNEALYRDDFNTQTRFQIVKAPNGSHYLVATGSGQFATESGVDYRWNGADTAVAKLENYDGEALSIYEDSRGQWYIVESDHVPEDARNVSNITSTAYAVGSGAFRTMQGTDSDDILTTRDDNVTDYISGGKGGDFIYGNGGDDGLHGDDGDDTIYGGNGNDYISGGKGNDLIYGESGNDTLYGNEGHDIIFGGAGDDFIDGGEGVDLILGEKGNDILIGRTGNDIIYGGEGDDRINGDEGNDYLDGGAGDDALFAGTGNDTLVGGSGNDRLVASSDGVTVMHGGSGQDSFELSTAIVHEEGPDLTDLGQSQKMDIIQDFTAEDRIDVSYFVDFYKYKHNNDFNEKTSFQIVTAPDGNKYLVATSTGQFATESSMDYRWVSADTPIVRLDNFNDEALSAYQDNFGKWYVVATSALPADARNVSDVQATSYAVGSDAYRIGTGTEENDIFNAPDDDQTDYITAGDGNDIIHGGGGNDALYGEKGNDTLYGDDGDDHLFGGTGIDQLTGGAGNDTLYGDEGSDKLWGNDGDDTLYGGAGNDYLSGDTGNDILVGGTGNDTFFINNSHSVDLGIKTIADFEAGDIIDVSQLAYEPGAGFPELGFRHNTDGSIEVFNANNSNKVFFKLDNVADTTLKLSLVQQYSSKWILVDSSTITPADNVVASYILGTDNNDTVSGTSFDDIIIGEGGDDLIHGNYGNDKIDGGAGNDVITGGHGDDKIHGGSGNDRIDSGHGNDEVHGGDGDDYIDGTTGNNVLYGDAGNDEIRSSYFDDTLHGGSGDDVLSGGGGNDSLYGDEGNDHLLGGSGSDTLNGGEGADTFGFILSSVIGLNLIRGIEFFGDPTTLQPDKISDLSSVDRIQIYQPDYGYTVSDELIADRLYADNDSGTVVIGVVDDNGIKVPLLEFEEYNSYQGLAIVKSGDDGVYLTNPDSLAGQDEEIVILDSLSLYDNSHEIHSPAAQLDSDDLDSAACYYEPEDDFVLELSKEEQVIATDVLSTDATEIDAPVLYTTEGEAVEEKSVLDAEEEVLVSENQEPELVALNDSPVERTTDAEDLKIDDLEPQVDPFM